MTSRSAPILSVENLQAHFRTSHFGVQREVRAVDGVTFVVRGDEIYGLAGESSSGKTTLIKTIAGLLKPPLEMVGGRAAFSFLPIEKEPPYAPAAWHLGAASHELGYGLQQRALAKLAGCLKNNRWPGYPETVAEIELPTWAHYELESKTA